MQFLSKTLQAGIGAAIVVVLAGCGHPKAAIVTEHPSYVIVRLSEEGASRGKYLIYSEEGLIRANEAAEVELNCDVRPCLLGSGGFLLSVERPE